VRAYWEALREAFGEARREGTVAEGTTWEDFVWAVTVVQSRAFRVDSGVAAVGGGGARGEEGEFALLPGLDMLNHSVVCKTKFELNKDTDSYEIRSGLGFEGGEQVFVSYGSKTNLDLLFFYGFVEGNNPADSVLVESSGVLLRVLTVNACTVGQRDEKCRLLRDTGLVADTKAYHVRRDALDDELMAILRVAFASEEEMRALDPDVLRSREALRRPLSLENELLAWRSISLECDRLLARLPRVSAAAAAAADELRRETICSAVWEWGAVGDGRTTGEALVVAERRDILEATRARVQHFIAVSERLGRVTTVLLPPSQSLLSTTVWEGLSPAEGTSGLTSFSL
jgi:hypothetical protein